MPNAHVTPRPFGVQGLEQRISLGRVRTRWPQKLNDQGLTAEGPNGGSLAGAVCKRELRQPIRNLAGWQCATRDSALGRARQIAGIGGARFAGRHWDPRWLWTASRDEWSLTPAQIPNTTSMAAAAMRRADVFMPREGRACVPCVVITPPKKGEAAAEDGHTHPRIDAGTTPPKAAACSGNSTLLMGG